MSLIENFLSKTVQKFYSIPFWNYQKQCMKLEECVFSVKWSVHCMSVEIQNTLAYVGKFDKNAKSIVLLKIVAKFRTDLKNLNMIND